MKKGSDVEEMYSNIHRALKTLLDTIPRVAPQLVPALSKHYPFRTRGPDVQVSLSEELLMHSTGLHIAIGMKRG